MPGPHPKELRERVIRVIEEEGLTIEQAAKRFCVSVSSTQRWLSAKKKTGSIAPQPMGGANRPCIVDEEGGKFVIESLNCNPDLTLRELCDLYKEFCDVNVSTQTMSDTVRRLGFTRKKGLFVAGLHSSLRSKKQKKILSESSQN